MQVTEVLERSPLCAGLSRNALKEMGSALVVESWPKNCEILAPSQPVERFRIVSRGRVKLTRSNGHDGRELTLCLLGPGDGFDVVSLLDGEPHAIAAWSLDEVETLSAPVSIFREWLERFPAFRLAMHRYVAHQLRQLTELASDLALHDTLTRLARLLLRHFDTAPGAGALKMDLIHNLPEHELASMIGSVRVVVSRLLGQLKRQAVVELHNGVLRLTDLRRLLRRAQGHLDRAGGRSRHDKAAKT